MKTVHKKNLKIEELDIDKTDLAILKFLVLNANQSIAEISRKSGLSRDILLYRMTKLEESGVIAGYRAIINQAAFCSGVANLSLKLKKTTDAREGEIIQYLLKHPDINWFAQMCGNSDITLTFLYNDNQELAKITSGIVDFIGDNIKDYQLSLYIEEYKFSFLGLLDKQHKKASPTTVFTKTKFTSIDDLDVVVLRTLAKDARIAKSALAKSVGRSQDALSKRILRLEKENYILGYTTIVDLQKLGYESYSINMSLKQLSTTALNKVKYYVQQHTNIVYAARTSGSWSIVLTAAVKNHAELFSLLKELKTTFSEELMSLEFQIMFKQFKTIYVPESQICK